MDEEDVVLTPSKKGKVTHIKIERCKKMNTQESQVAHVAGGEHSGLVVNKQDTDENPDSLGKPELQLGFMCFLVDQKTGHHVVESRKLKFWYREGTEYLDQVTTAYEFFKELVRPENFPRDYVGFIKKCMIQMRNITKYNQAKKIVLEIQQLESQEAPNSPDLSCDELGINKADTRSFEEILRERLLTLLESAYPNILSMDDLVRLLNAEGSTIKMLLDDLKSKDLVKEIEKGKSFVRNVLDTKTDVQMVQQMPTIKRDQQPTVAIITGMYYEKLAVDAMMENKITYMRYKTEGESNVYTIGSIGDHRVVSTKLPAVGPNRAAQISSGNTTTRLLGIFQSVDHVFLVGVAGGVPHYTDFYKHVRLGDVVVSRANTDNQIYYYCQKIMRDREGNLKYITKSWSPKCDILQKICHQMDEQHCTDPSFVPWQQYILEGLELMKGQEVDFSRPSPSTDHLYMEIGDNSLIEVEHPGPPEGAMPLTPGEPKIHHGIFGAGRPVARSDTTRLEFASKYDVRAYDDEYDQVLDSIDGNRKDSFLIVRGVCDYTDGAKHKEWQPYAAIAAAAYTKAIIKALTNTSPS